MGLFNFLFGSKDDSEDKDDKGEERDDDGMFTSIFGNPGDTTADEDIARGNYKEKDWYDK